MKKIFALCMLMMSFAVHSALTDIKFSRWMVADSQWNVNACLNTSTCQIYSKNPGTAYKIPWTSGQIQWATGDYIRFSLSGNANFPYTATQYTSAGIAKTTLGNGKIVNMGADYFFFVGSDNDTGQLFSGSSGMNNTGGVTWTGTRNPTIAQADAYADSTYSTEPLAAGQPATSTPSNGGGGGGGAAAIQWPTTSETSIAQVAARSTARARVSALGASNSVYLEERPGSSINNTDIEQTGSGNDTSAVIDGNNNAIVIRQGTGASKNLIELKVTGNLNIASVSQARNESTGLSDSLESGNHYLSARVVGNSNTLTLKQSNSGGDASGHFLSLGIAGSLNKSSVTQSGAGAKTIFSIITGASNTATIQQQGSSAFVDLGLTGNNHSATITQTGLGHHSATVNLTNSGGASTVLLTQTGATAQNILIAQQCAVTSGCAISVRQGQ